MKVAVTYDENEMIFQHFGHTERFKLYTVEDGKVVSSEVIDTAGAGHEALAAFLMRHGVDTLICGGIGPGAVNALGMCGIRVFGGITGLADLRRRGPAERQSRLQPQPQLRPSRRRARRPLRPSRRRPLRLPRREPRPELSEFAGPVSATAGPGL